MKLKIHRFISIEVDSRTNSIVKATLSAEETSTPNFNNNNRIISDLSRIIKNHCRTLYSTIREQMFIYLSAFY